MENFNQMPNLANRFNENTFVKHNVYRSNKHYKTIFVDKELYEEIFKEKFNEKSFDKISDIFSITIEKK
jgi:hypothetical protein